MFLFWFFFQRVKNFHQKKEMSQSDARSAYYSFSHDLRAAFRRDGYNDGAEIADWDEARHTINADRCIFLVRVCNLKRMSLAPPTGNGYQVLQDLSEFRTATTAPLRHGKECDTVIAAPALIDGTYVVSYRFSALRFVRAWLVYLILLTLRFAIVAVLVAGLAFAAWYVPWQPMWNVVANMGLERYEAYKAASPVPTPAPAHQQVFASRPVVGG